MLPLAAVSGPKRPKRLQLIRSLAQKVLQTLRLRAWLSSPSRSSGISLSKLRVEEGVWSMVVDRVVGGWWWQGIESGKQGSGSCPLFLPHRGL